MIIQIVKKENIPLGRWYAKDGSNHSVVVTAVDLASPAGWVTYEWEENGKKRTHEKSSFGFQCRYYSPETKVEENK
jgi:tagatose-1,6-bisphosphate aldolase non-catalytic subunit AgaZ/GatZ